nr:PREDICTED: T-cell surface antigen CD2-like [Lepisosteus oculatus]
MVCRVVSIFFISYFLRITGTDEWISTPSSVYGNLGDSVWFILDSGNLPNISDIIWKKEENRIARFRESESWTFADFMNRAEVFANGTLKVEQAREIDKGLYTVEIYDTNGKNVYKKDFRLQLRGEAPVFVFAYVVTHSVFQAIVSVLLIIFIIHQFRMKRKQDRIQVQGSPYFGINDRVDEDQK